MEPFALSRLLYSRLQWGKEKASKRNNKTKRIKCWGVISTISSVVVSTQKLAAQVLHASLTLFIIINEWSESSTIWVYNRKNGSVTILKRVDSYHWLCLEFHQDGRTHTNKETPMPKAFNFEKWFINFYVPLTWRNKEGERGVNVNWTAKKTDTPINRVICFLIKK